MRKVLLGAPKNINWKMSRNKDIQSCVGKVERKVAKSSSSGSTKKSDDGVGTLSLFLTCKTTRDLDKIGKSDLLFPVAVGIKKQRKAQVSFV